MQKVMTDNNGNMIVKRPMSLQERLNNVKTSPQKKQQETIKDKKDQFSSYKQQHTKYQVNENSFFIIKFGLIQFQGRFIVIDQSQVPQYDTSQLHWVKFRMWTYKQELQWKDACLKYNLQSRSFVLDNQKLNEKKIRNLILDWSFAEHSQKFKLLHVNKYLSDQSYQIFKGFFPNIINEIIIKMNKVLQNNG